MKRISVEVRVLFLMLVLLIAGSIVFATDTGEESSSLQIMPSRSSYSAQPDGCKALLLALQKSGYAASRLRIPFTSLEDKPGVLISLSTPRRPSDEEWDAVAGWVRRGGTLIVSPGEWRDEYKPETDRLWKNFSPEFQTGVFNGVINLAAHEKPLSHDLEAPARDRMWDDAATILSSSAHPIVRYATVGHGSVLLLCAPEIASNDGVAKENNLRFLVNVIGAPTKPVWFDEFHHGYHEEANVWSHLPNSVILGLIVLGLGGLVLVWALSRRLGAPLPEPVILHERSEYVDSMATVLKNANATRLVARLWRKRARERLARELGGTVDDNLGALASSRGVDVGNQTAAFLGALDRACAGTIPIDGLLRLAHDESNLWKELKKNR